MWPGLSCLQVRHLPKVQETRFEPPISVQILNATVQILDATVEPTFMKGAMPAMCGLPCRAFKSSRSSATFPKPTNHLLETFPYQILDVTIQILDATKKISVKILDATVKPTFKKVAMSASCGLPRFQVHLQLRHLPKPHNTLLKNISVQNPGRDHTHPGRDRKTTFKRKAMSASCGLPRLQVCLAFSVACLAPRLRLQVAAPPPSAGLGFTGLPTVHQILLTP